MYKNRQKIYNWPVQCMRRVSCDCHVAIPKLNQRLSRSSWSMGDEDQQVEWKSPPTCSPAAANRL